MCGRYTFVPDEHLFKRLGVKKSNDLQLPLRYNVTPGSLMPVIKPDLNLDLMKWGLIPHWARDPKIGYRMINARAETLTQKPSFKEAVTQRRCLIPASGFYEWQTENGKVPYYFCPPENSYLLLAGLFDHWTDANGETVASYTIITTEPNETVAPIHNRMPAIIKHEEMANWLEAESAPNAISLLKPYSDELMSREVSTAVNSPASEGEQLIEPV